MYRVIDAVWRVESARLIVGLARIVRDVGQAEDLAHDALVAALEKWPQSGVPENPGAWLMAAARHRAVG
jgi:predicted RNA polymerase sigma factor